jgi:endonuclease/exonuclease/phosphatase family metal-dependent hydrolase
VRFRRLAIAVAVLAGMLGADAEAQGSSTDAPPLCGSSGTVAAPLTAAPLKVGTYNILHTLEETAYESLDTRLELQADVLAAADVDVVGLQEVVGETAEHGNAAERLASEMAERTSQRWEWCWFQSNPHFPGEPDVDQGGGGPVSEQMALRGRNGAGEFREGLAVISRFPIGERAVRRLPPRSYEAAACTDVPPDPLGCNLAAAFESRAVLWTRIGDVDLFNTHFAHGITELSPASRLVHTELALAFVDEKANREDASPDLLVGDFNSVEHDPVHDRITAAGWTDTFREKHPTDPGITSHQVIRSPEPANDARIDFVFARPGACASQVVDSEVIGDSSVPYQDGVLWPSDHYGVVSTVRSRC